MINPSFDLITYYDSVINNRRLQPTEFQRRQTLFPAISRLEQIRYYKERIGKENSLSENKFFASGYINLTNYDEDTLYYKLLDEINQLYSTNTIDEICDNLQISNTTLNKIISGECKKDKALILAILCKINPEHRKKLPEKISGDNK